MRSLVGARGRLGRRELGEMLRRGHAIADESHAPGPAHALAPVRRLRHVEGRVVALHQRSVSETVPALVAIVRDAAGEETKLIWLGRVSIRGVEMGARLRASGLASTVKTIPAIYNPAYDLLPAASAADAAPKGHA